MMFTANHKIVQDYVLLIKNKLKTLDEVPNFNNLREVVSLVLAD